MIQFIASRVLAVAALIATAWGMTGCGSYGLQGRVVTGDYSAIEIVHKDDPRLQTQGIAGAEVRVMRDPNKPNRHLVGQARSGSTGDFVIIMDEFGTGWMSEEWLVQAAAARHSTTEQLLKLPTSASKWRVLVTMPPGASEPLRNNDDLMQDLERFK